MTAAAPAGSPGPSGAAPARVMICDDSAVIRAVIGRMLESDPAIQIVARVANGQFALDEVKRRRGPDGIEIVVLDIEMPVMDGLTALPLLLQASPGLRVIMASTLTTRGADVALRALRLGAADYVPKPSASEVFGDASFQRELIEKVKGLARMRRRAGAATTTAPAAAISLRRAPSVPPRLLAIGSSTGGPQALFTLVQGLGKTLPVPVILTQHMPPTFIPILADHITRLGGLPCAEAQDGETLAPGRIHVAPGDQHLTIRNQAGALKARLSAEPPENFCRPAVDPMLRSACTAVDGRMLVVMLTGMGQDGLAGTRKVVEAGGAAIAQDEATSVVWGMPGAIARAGLCHAVLPLPRLPAKILDLLQANRT